MGTPDRVPGSPISSADLQVLQDRRVTFAQLAPPIIVAAGELPVAYVVARTPVSAEELMAYVAARVAPQKKIRAVEFIEQIPKAASGKLLRRVLVERERARFVGA